MTAIAAATRSGQPVHAATLARIADASRKAPLMPEPFLVRGVEAQLSGNSARAEQAFLAAEWRDGRSLPARYFLADQYFRTGNAAGGLREIAALARLAPNGATSLAPYVAAYARSRSNWPEVRALLATEPAIEENTLAALASDPDNADAVLAVANPHRSGPNSAWLKPLLDGLIRSGKARKARAIWAEVAHVREPADGLIYDPLFKQPDAPPPFNWALTSSTVGLAERRRGGGLHVIFYGQEDGTLAAQFLLLPPGTYRLETAVSGSSERAGALRWELTCTASTTVIDSFALDASPRRAWEFVIPSNCPAQQIELVGRAGDLPQQVELTIPRITLSPGRPNA
jgi:hypothetical protein